MHFHHLDFFLWVSTVATFLHRHCGVPYYTYTTVTLGLRVVADHSQPQNSWSFWVVADDHAMVLE